MAHTQTGEVAVMSGEGTHKYTWATSVKVDRHGALHIYGHHKQHAVHLYGEWTGYLVKAPHVDDNLDSA
jgi:hypothetical protein